MFAPRRSQGGHPLSRRGLGATLLTCWAGRSTPGLAFSGSGSRSRCSSPFLGCMCRHRQVTPHSARMLVAVPSVAPSAITGTDSTMVPARGAGLGPAAAHPPGPARPVPPPAARQLGARQQLSRRRRGGEGGRLRGRQRRGPDPGWLVRSHSVLRQPAPPPRQHVTRPPTQLEPWSLSGGRTLRIDSLRRFFMLSARRHLYPRMAGGHTALAGKPGLEPRPSG